MEPNGPGGAKDETGERPQSIDAGEAKGAETNERAIASTLVPSSRLGLEESPT